MSIETTRPIEIDSIGRVRKIIWTSRESYRPDSDGREVEITADCRHQFGHPFRGYRR